MTNRRETVRLRFQSNRQEESEFMPPQEEHERPEDMVEAPGEAAMAARSLEDAVDSHGTLEGYYAMNDEKPDTSPGADTDREQAEDREKGHPVP